jgi:N-acetylmuramoyl-L-alanine amidase
MPGELIRLGDHGPAVAEIRASLNRLGCLPESVDGEADDVFDADMAAAIRQFQQERGLLADGIVGPLTYRALDDAHWRFGDRLLRFQPGHLMTGDDVVVMQRHLYELGFDVGRIDGEFGALTQGGVREFQRNMGLAPDGVVGPKTLATLNRLSPRVTGGRPDALRAMEARRAAGPRLSGKVVVLDPGSVSDDEEVTIDGISTSQVVADVVNRLEGRLAVTGVSVYRTRPSAARAMSVADRAALANATQANIFVSLFIDQLPNSEASGVACYYYGRDEATASAEGEQVASMVQRELVARTGLTDCRTHPKTWDLLRRTQMPAVLVSLGYLTNAADRARLANPAFRDTLAEGMAAALQRLYLPEEADADTGSLSVTKIQQLSESTGS